MGPLKIKWCWKHDILFLLCLWENEIFSSTVDFSLFRIKILQTTNSSSLCPYGITCLLFSQTLPKASWHLLEAKQMNRNLPAVGGHFSSVNIKKTSPGMSCRSSDTTTQTQTAAGSSQDLGFGILSSWISLIFFISHVLPIRTLPSTFLIPW